MKTLLFYVLQVVLCSGMLYGYYLLMLRNKKFHQYNRFYLLLVVVLSFIIPLLEFTIPPEELSVVDSQVLQNIFIKSYKPATTSNLQQIGSWLLNNAISIVYVLIAAFFLFRLVKSVGQLLVIKHKYKAEKLEHIQLFRTNEPGTPFSFFNWLFWDNNIVMESDNGRQIFKHELYHIQQKHSWDIIAMELVCVVGWMNPFFHLIRKEQATIHEFLADRYAMQHQDKWDYAELLLLQALTHKKRLTHPFFNNQIKRRIAMITNVNKTSFLYLRKILVLPMLLIVVALFAINCSNDNTGKNDQPVTDKDTTKDLELVKPGSITNDTVPAVQEITIVEERKAPPKIEEPKFILPKRVKDGDKIPPPPKVEMKKFTPPKVIKDEENKLPTEEQWKEAVDESGKSMPVYGKVEVEASFPGGVKAWETFLQRNLNAAIPVEKGAPAGRYTIYAQFIVDKDGNISDLKTLTNHGFGMEKEVLRVLRLTNKWMPAHQGGKTVKAYRKQPITFVVEEEKK
jgi:beta-lactamase regulating signal transducer with metallopeptidase domain